MCALGCGDIVRGVSEVVIILAKSLSPTNFEFSPKALRNPKVESSQSPGRFGDYIRGSDSAKILQILSKTALLEILFGVSM